MARAKTSERGIVSLRPPGSGALAKSMPAARRLSRILLAAGSSSERVSCGLRAALFMRAAARRKGSALGEGQNPQGALSFPFTRRLLKKAGENF